MNREIEVSLSLASRRRGNRPFFGLAKNRLECVYFLKIAFSNQQRGLESQDTRSLHMIKLVIDRNIMPSI